MPSKFADCRTVNNVLVKLACHFSETGQIRNFDLSTIMEAENRIAALTVEREPEDEGETIDEAEQRFRQFEELGEKLTNTYSPFLPDEGTPKHGKPGHWCENCQEVHCVDGKGHSYQRSGPYGDLFCVNCGAIEH